MGRVDRELVDALEQAIAMQPVGSDAVLAELLAALASELEWADDGDRRFELSDRAVEIARNVDDPSVLARVLTLRTITIDAPDTLRERIADCDELLGLADTIGDPAIGFHAVWSRSPTAVESGDADAVDKLVEIASNLADDLRLPAFLWQASFMRTARLILRGELDEAERLAGQTLELGQRAGQQIEAFVFYNEQILEIRRWQDRLGEVSSLLRDFAGADLWDFGYSLTRYLYDAHEIELATARYESIVQRVQLPPRRDLLAGTSLCNLAYLATRLGDTERAAQLYGLIEPYRSAFASTTVAKPVGEHFLGLIASALDDFSAAERHFESACHAHERARAPLLVAETQVEWAAVLGRQGERGRARELVDAARANVRGRGAAFVARRCDEVQV